MEGSDRRADIERRRRLRRHFLSRAEVRRILADPACEGPTLERYRGDLQMHSEWSDGHPTVQEIADACLQRGYQYAAVTDHSYGLKIAGGMSMAEAAEQRKAIDDVNARHGKQFRLLQGIEANIDTAGRLDLTDEEAATFDVVLAAPHSRLRKERGPDGPHADRGRPPGGPDPGPPARSDHRLAGRCGRPVARRICGGGGTGRGHRARWGSRAPGPRLLTGGEALAAGCLFALDSDAHTTGQLAYAETAIAHARIAGIPAGSDRQLLAA